MAKDFRLAKRTSVHLDVIRGVSAFAVMLYHLRGVFFLDFAFLTKKSLPISALYALTGFGHQAVMIFFVLSGYFIGASVMDSVGRQEWSWRKYLVSRVTRLQLVLVPALVLGGIWDRIGMKIPQAFPIYYDALYKFYGPSVALRSTVEVFFGNLLFLQSIVSPVFGSNTPLWSLSYEFWYYLAFPFLILAVTAWVGARLRFVYACLALLVLWFLGPLISSYFVIWLAGALVGRIRRLANFKTSSFVAQLLAGLIFFGALAWSRNHRLSTDLRTDYVVGICFAIWLYTLLLGSREDFSPTYANLAKKLAGCSYTLYLTHLPALILLRALFDVQGNWQPDALHLFYGVGIAMLILSYAYTLAHFTEARTESVRRWILRPRVALESEPRT